MSGSGSKGHGQPERRANPRARLRDLACMHFGPDNGAIVLDASDSGILFYAVAPIHQTGVIQLTFSLWNDRRVDAVARLVWIDDTRKSGGLEFISLPADVREHVRRCCPEHSFPSQNGKEIGPAQPKSDDHRLPEPAQPIAQPQVIVPELKKDDRSAIAVPPIAAAVSAAPKTISRSVEKAPTPSRVAAKTAVGEPKRRAKASEPSLNAARSETHSNRVRGEIHPAEAGFRIGIAPQGSRPDDDAWKKLIGQKPVAARLSTSPEGKVSISALASGTACQALLVTMLIALPVFFPRDLATKILYDVVPVAAVETAVLLPPKAPVVRTKPQAVPPAEPTLLQPRVVKLAVPRALLPPKAKPADVRSAAAPEINQPIVQVRIEPPSAEPARPREPVKTGLLTTGSAAPATVSASVTKVQTGGFGDPNGLPGPADPHQRANIAHFGSLALPSGPGEGNGTGGANGVRGTVASAGFGNGVAVPQVAASSSRGEVKSGNFAAATIDTESPKAKTKENAAAAQPMVILEKPNPVYSEEARRMAIEGEVLVGVVFSASGQVQIIRVVKGLGHGLDEAAARAAQQIRFKPALQDGQPVDFPAVVHIVFQLAF